MATPLPLQPEVPYLPTCSRLDIQTFWDVSGVLGRGWWACGSRGSRLPRSPSAMHPCVPQQWSTRGEAFDLTEPKDYILDVRPAGWWWCHFTSCLLHQGSCRLGAARALGPIRRSAPRPLTALLPTAATRAIHHPRHCPGLHRPAGLPSLPDLGVCLLLLRLLGHALLPPRLRVRPPAQGSAPDGAVCHAAVHHGCRGGWRQGGRRITGAGWVLGLACWALRDGPPRFARRGDAKCALYPASNCFTHRRCCSAGPTAL